MFSARLLRAIRLIRAGSEPREICTSLQLQRSTVRHLEAVCENVPDDILMQFEQALSANEKLRRLIAGLGRENAETPIFKSAGRSAPLHVL